MAQEVPFIVELSSFNSVEVSVKGQHVSVEQLRDKINQDTTIMKQVEELGRTTYEAENHPGKPKILDYLLPSDPLPKFPTPVKFHISHVCHVTTKYPASMILDSEEFRPPNSEYSWWSLKTEEGDKIAAGRRYMEEYKIPPGNMELQREFITNFTTSPVFRHESRYGNYRFTFTLQELMAMYGEQFCGGKKPVLRVFKTMFYRQEIVYAVLVHSPEDEKEFGDLPYLQRSKFISYQDGKMIWHAQAISNPITHVLNIYRGHGLSCYKHNKECYNVWDIVCLAFYLPSGKSFKVPKMKLVGALEACQLDEMNLLRACHEERKICFERARAQVAIWKEDVQDVQN